MTKHGELCDDCLKSVAEVFKKEDLTAADVHILDDAAAEDGGEFLLYDETHPFNIKEELFDIELPDKTDEDISSD